MVHRGATPTTQLTHAVTADRRYQTLAPSATSPYPISHVAPSVTLLRPHVPHGGVLNATAAPLRSRRYSANRSSSHRAHGFSFNFAGPFSESCIAAAGTGPGAENAGLESNGRKVQGRKWRIE